MVAWRKDGGEDDAGVYFGLPAPFSCGTYWLVATDIFQKAQRRDETIDRLLALVEDESPEDGAALLAEAALRKSKSQARPAHQQTALAIEQRPHRKLHPLPEKPSSEKTSSGTLPSRREYGATVIATLRRKPTATNAEIAKAVYGADGATEVKNIRTLIWTLRRDGKIGHRDADGKVEVLVDEDR